MEWDNWFRDKSFTTDWTSYYYSVWVQKLAKLRDRDVSVLEIGSWEGRSAIFFLEFLPRCRVTCIDTFAGGPEYTDLPDGVVSSVEARFDSNLAAYGDRVRKVKSRSLVALDQLALENNLFDLIYIDGSHARDDVLIDSLLAWPLLRPDGICIWDDYTFAMSRLPSAQRPQHAIDAFLELHGDELTVCHFASQVIVEKRRSARSLTKNLLTFPRTPANLVRFLKRRPLRTGGHGST